MLFIDLVKAFDRVPREMLWQLMLRFGVPAKLVSLLQSMHKRVQVLFEVEGVKCSLESIIGVKQGDLKAPVEFVFFIAGIMLSWRAVSDYPLCIMRSRDDALGAPLQHGWRGRRVHGRRQPLRRRHRRALLLAR